MGCFDRSPSDSSGVTAAQAVDAGSSATASEASAAGAGAVGAGESAAAAAGAGGAPRGSTSPVTACKCATKLQIKGCRCVPVNGTIQLTASIDCGAGSFQWSTPSSKVTLTDAASSTVQVKAGAHPSAARDAETITVKWTDKDCSPLSASVNITVVNVVFSESAAESYGYDDMDTPATHTDDHVSVQKLKSTVVHVVVQGGLNGNELEFATLDDTIATVNPAPAQPAFDLTINGRDQNQKETNLVARVNCPDHAEITRMFINVYSEKVVRAVVAKVFDSRHAGTNLLFPNLNVPSAQTMINPKAKAAVVRYELSDQSATGGAVDIPYDIDGNGKLSWDIVKDGGAEFDVIKDKFKSSDQRIVIVRDMVSLYYLDAAAAKDATTITLRGINNNNWFTPGKPITIGAGAAAENGTVKTGSNNSATVTLNAPLARAHAAGDPVTFYAGGWGSDPIVILEGSASEDILKWTFFHETGHRVLKLNDLEAPTSIMHHSQGWTDHRLRYKPQNNFYNPPGGTQNQWETIPRPTTP